MLFCDFLKAKGYPDLRNKILPPGLIAYKITLDGKDISFNHETEESAKQTIHGELQSVANFDKSEIERMQIVKYEIDPYTWAEDENAVIID